jgi:hypothetical protein
MIARAVGKTHIDCPCCRQKTYFSVDSPTLALNYALMDVLRAAQAVADPATICEECDEKAINVFCELCQISVCKYCLSKIHAPKSFQKHSEHVVSAFRSKRFGVEKCKVHQEPLKLFCVVDQVFICLLCRDYGEHKGHDVDLASSEMEKSKRTVSEMMVKINALRSRFKDYDAALETAAKNLDVNSEDALSSVTVEIEKAIEVLRSKLQRMEESILEMKARKLSKLSKRRETVNSLLVKLEKVVSSEELLPCEGLSITNTVKNLNNLIADCHAFEAGRSSFDVDMPIYFEDLAGRIDAYCSVGEPIPPEIYQSSGEVSSGDFFLSWTQIDSAASYLVEMQIVDFMDKSWEEIYRGAETSTSFVLYSSSIYRFRVSAVSLAGFKSEPSGEVELRTSRTLLEWDLGFVCPGYPQQYSLFEKCRAIKVNGEGTMTIMRTRDPLPNDEFILWKVHCEKQVPTGEFHIGIVPYDWNWSSCWLKGRGYEFDVQESCVFFCCF